MKIYKKHQRPWAANLGLFILSVLMASQVSLAQRLDANRTTETKIADLLNRFPTETTAEHETAMQEMAGFQTNELTTLALMLTENGNNEKLEYALSGFSFYASQPDKETEVENIVKGYGDALNQINFDEGRSFLIENLRIMGNDDAVPYLAGFLANERLVSPASRALASIGSPAAQSVLVEALIDASPNSIKAPIIEALGDSEAQSAAAIIEPYANATDQELKKVAIYSLANIAEPSSKKVLSRAAKAANYKYEETHAASEYLTYAQNLVKKGETKLALSIAKEINRATKSEDQFHTKAGALNLLVQLQPNKADRVLRKAAVSSNATYRNVALDLALENGLSDNLESWTKVLRKADDEIKVDLIRTLGHLKNDAAFGIIRPYIQDDHPAVKQQAIASAVLAGGDKALPDYLAIINRSSEDEVNAVRSALLSMGGNNVINEVVGAIPNASSAAKVALIQVLAARPNPQHMNVLLAEVKSSDQAVKEAAFSALGSLATPDHLNQLVELLRGEQNQEYLKQIQAAIISANAQRKNPAQQTSWALQTLKTLPNDKQIYLYDVLSDAGGATALSSLNEIYQQGNGAQKNAALAAIAEWSSPEALDVLYHIAQSGGNRENADTALQGYINLVDATDLKPEGKVILLRNALEIAKSARNKQLALRQLTQYPTFQALLTAGKYLDEKELQQQAARTVMGIALEDPSIYGEEIRSIVQKTMEVIAGADSEYYKTSLQKHLDEMPKNRGFYSIFNEKNLDGWKGLVANPIKRAEMSSAVLAREQAKADKIMEEGWIVEDGLLVFTGKGSNLVTEKKYGDFEMFVDWKITEKGDAGIYLRGTPQVQIWDTALIDVGAQVGSGGLYNNQVHPSKPLTVADNPVGEWNTFHIIMKGDRVTVSLNGELVVDNVILENYWDRSLPIFPEEQIELQAHGTYVAYRDIYIKELPSQEPFELSEEEKKEGFEVLFDGENMHHWTGNTTDYVIENGEMVIYPDRGGKGNLFTKKEYGDFIFRFEFKLTPGANNGLGIRSPLEGDAAYVGMELQILDNTADIYKNLQEYQFHGSLYGIAAAKKGHLKPVGEWNYQEVRVIGDEIQVILNGATILEVNIAEPREKGTLDGRDHPGLSRKSGHIGFLGHGDVVFFRNIRVKDLSK